MHTFNHRTVSSRQNQDPFLRRIGNDPSVDWLLMLSAFVMIGVLFAAVGFGVYSDVDARLAAPATTAITEHTDVFDPNALTQVLDVFKDRTAAKDMIIQGVGIPSDPSL